MQHSKSVLLGVIPLLVLATGRAEECRESAKRVGRKSIDCKLKHGDSLSGLGERPEPHNEREPSTGSTLVERIREWHQGFATKNAKTIPIFKVAIEMILNRPAYRLF